MLLNGLLVQVGSISGVTILNLNVTSENGMVLVGMPDTPIQNVSIVNTSMRLQNMTSWPGGFMDLRPGILGKREGTVDSGIYIENVQQLQLKNLQVPALTHPACRHEWQQQPCAQLPTSLTHWACSV